MKRLTSILFIIALILAGCRGTGDTNLTRASLGGEAVGQGARLAQAAASPTTTATSRATATAAPTRTPSPTKTIPPETTTSTPTPTKSPTAAPTPTLEPSPTPASVAVITADRVNLRSGPGTDFEIVGRLTLSTTLTIVGQDEATGWWEVCCTAESEQPAWVIDDYVLLRQPTSAEIGTAKAAGLASAMAEPLFVAPSLEEEQAMLRALYHGAELTEADVSIATETQLEVAAAPAAPAPEPVANTYTDLPALGEFAAPVDLNPLTGLALPAAQLNEPPVIVCINNDYAARPQFGTSQADVMYEYLMEGYGITRFSGLFYGSTTEQIGPVRSARLVNYYLGALYNAPLFCSGASDQVRYLLKNVAPFAYLDVDLDDPNNTHYSISIGTGYRTRLRTSTPGLHQWLIDWELAQPARIRGFTFGPTHAVLDQALPATDIAIPYPSSTGSNVEYRYDETAGQYLRWLGDEAHTDGNTGVQLALDNVIVQYVPHQDTDIVEDSLGSTSIRLNLFGGDRAIIFRDGLAFEGTWQSSSRGDTPRFLDQNGVEIPLKPGKTWISIVPARYEISYQ